MRNQKISFEKFKESWKNFSHFLKFNVLPFIAIMVVLLGIAAISTFITPLYEGSALSEVLSEYHTNLVVVLISILGVLVIILLLTLAIYILCDWLRQSAKEDSLFNFSDKQIGRYIVLVILGIIVIYFTLVLNGKQFAVFASLISVYAILISTLPEK